MQSVIFFSNVCEGTPGVFVTNSPMKHCEIFTYHGDLWVHFKTGKHGIEYQIYKNSDLQYIVNMLQKIDKVQAILHIEQRYSASFNWLPYVSSNCNEFVRFIGGLDIGYTRTPYHLFKKLVKYDGTTNYRIRMKWERTVDGQLE